MAVLTMRTQEERDALALAVADRSRTIVVSLCAAWCDTCNEFRDGYERLSQARPAMTFVWLDIEDDADIAGDIDVENFPTLAIYRGTTPLHFGVSLPHETTVGRLIDALAARAPALEGVPPGVAALPAEFLKRGDRR